MRCPLPDVVRRNGSWQAAGYHIDTQTQVDSGNLLLVIIGAGLEFGTVESTTCALTKQQRR